ncbi:acetamidase [Acidobacteria bacterium Mor1]|nr:acetamidase [Acidobacteria bacterium Mor1]
MPTLTREQTHNKFSRDIEPRLRVPSGTTVRFETEEATDGQLTPDSTAEDLLTVDFDRVHPLTGPVFVEGAEPGDVLKVTLERVEAGGWGWNGILPGFSYLADEFTEPYLRTYEFDPDDPDVRFLDGVRVPLRPFPGVIAVAPDTSERLNTIPPRANGGNMDDKDLTEGAIVYLPVFVPGALFSIGDGHAAQGDGEVCGTAIEIPMTVEAKLEVIKGGRSIKEPQYEHAGYYAVTAFGTDLDQAGRKATRYMLDYLVEDRGLDRTEAYALASVAADLKIAEVVDLPHMLVTMKIPKDIFVRE